ARVQLKGVRQISAGADADGLTDDERALLDAANGRVLVTILHGSFSYASARELARRASPTISGVKVAVYDFSQVGYVDTSAALAIEEMLAQAQARGMQVLVAGLTGALGETLWTPDVLKRVPAERIFAPRTEAIAAAVQHCEDTTSGRGSEAAAPA